MIRVLRPGRRRLPALVVAGLVVVGLAGAVSLQALARTGSPTPGRSRPGAVSAIRAEPAPATSSPVLPVVGISPIEPYREAVRIAGRHQLRVWLEADLVERWLAGRSQFDAGISRLATLAREPAVVGFKVADELGYHDGMHSSAQILAFLHDTSKALRAASPGKKLLIDMIVPELGCLPGLVPARLWPTVAGVHERANYPQLELGQIDRYVGSGTIDILDLSSGLQSERTYAGWGTDRDAAQQLAWKEVRRRGWASQVTLQARKAFATAGGYSGPAVQADADLRTWVDLPARDGALAVDVWTWAQQYQGRLVTLLGHDLRSNPLWDGLLVRRARGTELFTHFTPSQTLGGVDPDLARLSTVFTDVFLATGTG